MLLLLVAMPMTVVESSCHVVMKAPVIGSLVLPVVATATSIEDKVVPKDSTSNNSSYLHHHKHNSFSCTVRPLI
jgi:hypothetical protein